MDRQAELEATARPGSSLLSVTEPTETAVAAAFGHTARLAGRPANEAPLREVGQLFGRVAHLLDAVEDYRDDVARGKWNPLAAKATPVADIRALCDDAALGIELALADVEFTDGRLPRRLLTRELRRAVSRTFSRAGYTAHSETPRGQQEPINFGSEELEPGPKQGQASRWEGCGCYGCDRWCDGCDCYCCDADCCDADCCDADCCDCS